jgi:hypothetical protein
MNEVVKVSVIDIDGLINKSDISLSFKSKLIDKLEDTFNEDEKRWYIANLYMYLYI